MRLDLLLVENNVYPSRNKANEAIKKGLVLYKGKQAKPSLDVENLDFIKVIESEISFVSNGGYKLHKALNDFNFSVNNLTFADIGASNGGFTDCLLQNGATKVYAIDVGESQLDKKLLTKNVIVLDNTNARYLTYETLGEKVDGVTCDVSFISLKYVIPTIKNLLKENGVAFLLIKPQFECGKEFLNNNGIVTNKKARVLAISNVYNYILSAKLVPINLTTAPINEKKNIEYIIMLENSNNQAIPLDYLLNNIKYEVTKWK